MCLESQLLLTGLHLLPMGHLSFAALSSPQAKKKSLTLLGHHVSHYVTSEALHQLASGKT